MRDRRPRVSQTPPSTPAAPVPDAQARALDRRHSLDEQQRAFRASYPAPHLFRRRPPC